jgi:hypothetical protein
MASAGFHKTVLRRGPCFSDRRADASALCGDLLVGRASAALFELVGTISGKDEMSMRVDESRRDDTPAHVDNLSVLSLRLDLEACSHSDDAAIANEHRPVGDNAKLEQLRTDAWA